MQSEHINVGYGDSANNKNITKLEFLSDRLKEGRANGKQSKMQEHGDYDKESAKWYCSYWMSTVEWEEVHDYSPPTDAVEKNSK